MNTPTPLDAPHVVVLKSNRFHADFIGLNIQNRWPKARVSVFYSGNEALKCIWQTRPDLFVTGIKIDDLEGLEHLEPFTDSELPILIVTACADATTVRRLRRVRFDGLFDSLEEGLERLLEAIEKSLRRQRYVSPRVARWL
ncbi:MAG TPA: hypothetical protein VGD81_07255 [Opitutaceae bacterium]